MLTYDQKYTAATLPAPGSNPVLNGQLVLYENADGSLALKLDTGSRYVDLGPRGGSNDFGSVTVDAINAVNATTLGLVDGDVIRARGRAAAYDGDEDDFTYRSASSATVDNVIVFAPTAGGGRLLRRGWTSTGFTRPVTPQMAGATPGGVVNCLTHITAACATGYVVDGGGALFGVSGRMELTTLKKLQNIRLVQLTPTATNTRTIHINGPTTWELENVSVDMGGNFTFGDTSTKNDWAGIWATGGAGTMRNVNVFNGGASSAISLQSCSKVVLDNVRVYSMRYELAAAADDIIQAMWVNNCTQVNISNSYVYGFTATIAGVATLKFHRGFTFGGCGRVSLVNCHAADIDQGFDFTGSAGNTAWSVTNCTAKDIGTWGFKGANTAVKGVMQGCTAENCGQGGFVFSGASGAVAPIPYTSKVTVIGCTSINAGSNLLWANAKGFFVSSNATVDATWPRNIQFIGCHAIDDQVSPTMDYGFLSDVPLTASGVLNNELIGCTSVGHTAADFSGFYSPRVEVYAAAAQATVNDTGYTVLFDTDTYDPLNAHSTSSETHKVIAPWTGVYQVEATVEWATNNTGRRVLLLQKNGATVPGGTASIGDGNNSGVAAVQINKTIRLAAGDFVNLSAVQNSGGALNITAAYLTMTLLRTST